MNRMNCDVIRDLLPLYAEDIASEASCKLVEEHLEQCADCRAELEQIKSGEMVHKPLLTTDPLRKFRRKWKQQVAAVALPLAVLLACILSLLPNFLNGMYRLDAVLLIVNMLIPAGIAIGSLLLGRTGKPAAWLLPVGIAAAVWLGCEIFDTGLSLMPGQVFLTLPSVFGMLIGFIMYAHGKWTHGRKTTAQQRADSWFARHKYMILAIAVIGIIYAVIEILWLCADGGDAFGASVVEFFLLIPLGTAVSALLLGMEKSRLKWLGIPVYFLLATAECWIHDNSATWGASVLIALLPGVLGMEIGHMLHCRSAKKGKQWNMYNAELSRKKWLTRHKKNVWAGIILLLPYMIAGILCIFSDAGDILGLLVVTYCLLIPLGGAFSAYLFGLGSSKYKWCAVVLNPLLAALSNVLTGTAMGWNILVPFAVIPAAFGLLIGHVSWKRRNDI